MTELRIAAVNGERTLTLDLSGVADSLKGFAELLESGRASSRTAIMLSVNNDGMLEVAWMGEGPSISEALGLLELAKAKIINGAWRA